MSYFVDQNGEVVEDGAPHPAQLPARTNQRVHDSDIMLDKLERLGFEWADANAEADRLEKLEKTILSQIKIEKKTNGYSSDAAAETAARASAEFSQYVKNEVEQRRLANRAKVAYETQRSRIELWRTRAANERAAMNLT